MAENCNLCCEELTNNKRVCEECTFVVCNVCYCKLTKCPVCPNKDFGEYDPQKKSEEMSEYFKKENIAQGLEAAIALHNEINGEEEEEEPDDNFQEEMLMATFLSEEDQMNIALALSVN
jgi:hypothetical protein